MLDYIIGYYRFLYMSNIKNNTTEGITMTKYIYDKDSFDNSLEVLNYPWGFRLKTKRRTWIETNKNQGDRVCYSTLNPKTEKWCAVKKSTYGAVYVLYFDENQHIKSLGVSKCAYAKELEEFMSIIDCNSLSVLQKKQLERIKAIQKVMDKVTVSFSKVSEYNLSDPLDLIRMRRDNNSDETKAREQEQDKVKSQISSAINSTYNQALIKNNLK